MSEEKRKTTKVELSDDELEAVAGGCGGDGNETYAEPCPKGLYAMVSVKKSGGTKTCQFSKQSECKGCKYNN